jgi:AcrR family transcriptional regulator
MATDTGGPGVADEWSTRELILLHASRLFATRGFRGTSTRDICAAVGIRQPSMYSHFASKHAIADELLQRNLTAGNAALRRIAQAGGGPAVELYRYLRWEIEYDLTDPFDFRALFHSEILELPELADARALDAEYQALLLDVVERGIAGSDFVQIDPVYATRFIDAVILEAMQSAAEGVPAAEEQPDLAATLVLRALLKRPAQIGAVRRAADGAGS